MSEEPGQASGGDDRSNGRPARANDARGGTPRREFSSSAGRGGGALEVPTRAAGVWRRDDRAPLKVVPGTIGVQRL